MENHMTAYIRIIAMKKATAPFGLKSLRSLFSIIRRIFYKGKNLTLQVVMRTVCRIV